MSFLCTLVVQSVSWMFFNNFTPFGINGTVLQVRSDTVFPLCFVRQTPGVSFVFTPAAVLSSVFTSHRNFGDCGVWFSKISPFYVRFLEHAEQLITIPHQLFLKLPALSKEKYRKKSTNYPLTPPSDGVRAYWKEYLNSYLHTFVKKKKKSWKKYKLWENQPQLPRGSVLANQWSAVEIF